MAGNFNPSSTTFMNRHKAGPNSTGMYIISGIPQMLSVSGNGAENAAAEMVLDSLSREITITCPVAGTWNVWFHNAAAPVGSQFITVSNGMTITIPIRTTHVEILQTAGDANSRLTVVATLTGLDKTSYPQTRGDGKLTVV